MGIRDHPTAPRSPWQNGHVERLIGSIRRESLEHLVVFCSPSAQVGQIEAIEEERVLDSS
jgi:transposase InsO family protein